MTKEEIKNKETTYKITNSAKLNFYEVIDRINRVLNYKEVDMTQKEQLFACKDGIMIDFKYNDENLDINIYSDSKYSKRTYTNISSNIEKIESSNSSDFQGQYKTVKFKNLDCYVLNELDDVVELLLKDVLPEDVISKLVKSKDKIYLNGIYHNLNYHHWSKSYIKNKFLPAFQEYLKVPCEVDLLSDVRAKLLSPSILKASAIYWTKSAKAPKCIAIDLKGHLVQKTPCCKLAIRPTVIVSKKILEKQK